jgi:hypothetical protein
VRTLGLLLAYTLFVDAKAPPPAFQGVVGPVPAAVAARMRKHSFHEGCPTPIHELAYLRLSYLGYDGKMHDDGELVVHQALAQEVLDIFAELSALGYPIAKMRVVDAYGGDDDASMADNNTSAFNCRSVAGKPGTLSKHSLGRAIDVNPLVNPMIAKGQILPPGGREFADRDKRAPGLLRAGDEAVRAFTRRGWTWGGAWRSLKDYQHFEKSPTR